MKSSKLWMFLLAVILSVVGLTGCGVSRIGPGHVGVVVDLAGTKRGVQDYSVTTGWVLYNPLGTQIFEYPTYVQTYAFTASKEEGKAVDESITFTDKNAVKINADISLSYQLDPVKVPAFYVKFRNDDIQDFTFGYLHNVTRTAFDTIGGKNTVEDIMGDNGPFLREVQAEIEKEVSPIGVQIQQLGFIGYPRPPEGVVKAINDAQQAKYTAVQKQNELAQTVADANKKAAEAEGEARATIAKADAQAKANKILSESLTQALIQYRFIDQWDGKLSQVTTGSNGGLILSLPGLGNGGK